MDLNEGDARHCEEQLRNTLHCDDKEKLRRKLAQLQREYLKTAQRLQRAERLDAMRRHVRSRISQQRHQEQKEAEVASNSSSSIKNKNDAVVQGLPQCQGRTEGPTDTFDKSRRNQVIRFRLPPDAASPQTPDPGNDASGGQRPSSTLRLRSRRSRLRLERRSAEAGSSTDSNQQEQEGKMESAKMVVEEEGRVESKVGDEVNGSEELFSATESESPSLLLTHCNTHTETGAISGKENQRDQGQQEKEADLTTEERGDSAVLIEKTKVRTEDQRNDSKMEETGAFKGAVMENREQKITIKSEENSGNSVQLKEENNRITKAASLLDSCTIIEGLLFPAEYYVRTTRRMTLSQSQPDVQAVILSQLSTGRQRRSRGRGRGPNRNSHVRGSSDQHTQTGFSPLTTPSGFLDPLNSPHVGTGDASAECSQSSCDISNPIRAAQMDSEMCVSPPVTRPSRGRGRGRRRGRGRGMRRPLTSEDPQPSNTSVSSSLSVLEADRANTCLSPVQCDSEPGATQPSSNHNASPQPSSEFNGAAERVETVCTKGASSWQSLLLPSSSSPAQTSHLPPRSLFPIPFVSSLKNADILQDFHLPDDQFASLKLLKLRQVAVESGVEPFSTPPHGTRRSIRRADSSCGIGDPTVLLPLPLSFTPTFPDAHCPVDKEQQIQLQDSNKEASENNNPETNVEPQQLHAEAEDCEDYGQTEHEAMTPSRSQSCTSIRSIYRPKNCNRLDPQQNFVGGIQLEVNDPVTGHSGELKEQPAAEKQTKLCGLTSSSEAQITRNHQVENRATTKTLLSDHCRNESQEKPLNIPTSSHACNKTKTAQESPVHNKNGQCSFEEPSEPRTDLSSLIQTKTTCERCCSQLVLNSPPASVNDSFITPHHPPSPAAASSLLLPSLGITPRPPLTSFSTAPPFRLPPLPRSPSTQAPSPLAPPYPSVARHLPSLPPLSPCGQTQASFEPPVVRVQPHDVHPAACPNPSSVQLHGSHGPKVQAAEETADCCVIKHAHTLKAAAGGSLVDACCLPGSSGELFIAAAGKWAVCLWSQTSASDWSLNHTWSFREPVINVFPVPDSAGLVCVTLGQLEIREVRTLSCLSLSEMLLCEGVMQVVVALYTSRVVTSSHSATGSTLQVFTLSNGSSSFSCQPLVSPGACVGALAPVDELSDALVGTDEGGHLFIWNLNSGQLLCILLLGHGLSNTACLRGYSHCGVLLVLLQHQFLSSLDEEDKALIKDQLFSEEETNTALFSLVCINPLSGKSVLGARLYPPKAWSGRLCEADVHHSSVVGLSQSGCACVWELGKRTSRKVEAPEGEDWQLARWAGEDTLLIGHHNGDVSLLCYQRHF